MTETSIAIAIIGMSLGQIMTAISLNFAWREIRQLNVHSHTHFYDNMDGAK